MYRFYCYDGSADGKYVNYRPRKILGSVHEGISESIALVIFCICKAAMQLRKSEALLASMQDSGWGL